MVQPRRHTLDVRAQQEAIVLPSGYQMDDATAELATASDRGAVC